MFLCYEPQKTCSLFLEMQFLGSMAELCARGAFALIGCGASRCQHFYYVTRLICYSYAHKYFIYTYMYVYRKTTLNVPYVPTYIYSKVDEYPPLIRAHIHKTNTNSKAYTINLSCLVDGLNAQF